MRPLVSLFMLLLLSVPSFAGAHGTGVPIIPRELWSPTTPFPPIGLCPQTEGNYFSWGRCGAAPLCHGHLYAGSATEGGPAFRAIQFENVPTPCNTAAGEVSWGVLADGTALCVNIGAVPTATTTASTATPTPTESPTPTPTPTSTCDFKSGRLGNIECGVIVGPTPTFAPGLGPTLTPGAGATATPSPVPGDLWVPDKATIGRLRVGPGGAAPKFLDYNNQGQNADLSIQGPRITVRTNTDLSFAGGLTSSVDVSYAMCWTMGAGGTVATAVELCDLANGAHTDQQFAGIWYNTTFTAEGFPGPSVGHSIEIQISGIGHLTTRNTLFAGLSVVLAVSGVGSAGTVNATAAASPGRTIGFSLTGSAKRCSASLNVCSSAADCALSQEFCTALSIVVALVGKSHSSQSSGEFYPVGQCNGSTATWASGVSARVGGGAGGGPELQCVNNQTATPTPTSTAATPTPTVTPTTTAATPTATGPTPTPTPTAPPPPEAVTCFDPTVRECLYFSVDPPSDWNHVTLAGQIATYQLSTSSGANLNVVWTFRAGCAVFASPIRWGGAETPTNTTGGLLHPGNYKSTIFGQFPLPDCLDPNALFRPTHLRLEICRDPDRAADTYAEDMCMTGLRLIVGRN